MALKTAVEMEPKDPSNKADLNLMEEVTHQAGMIEKCGAEDHGMNEDIDYDKAASYCNSLLKNCPLAVHYMCLRILFLLKSSQLKEADAYTKQLLERGDIPYNS